MINRLIEPSGGRILIDGEDILAVDAVGAAAAHGLRVSRRRTSFRT